MRNLRLLIFSPYFPPHVGGLEGYVSDLNEVLLGQGEVSAVTVLTPRLPLEGMPREVRGERYMVVRYPAFELIPNFPIPKLWRRELWRALRDAHPSDHDVLVSHTRFFLTTTLALVCARIARRPLLHVEHGSDYVQLSHRFPRIAARVYDLLLGRLLLRRADGVVAISRAASDFVARLAGRDVPVIYRGMHVERLDRIVPAGDVLEWAGGRPVIAFVGRLIDGKGVADLLRAFAAIGNAPAAVACVVGDGPRRGELELLARDIGVGERVRFLGYLPEEQAWAVIRASDIVVNPSYTEGLPTSVLEAALMSKAVVASDVGGTREIVDDGQGGLLVDAHDIDGLRVQLELLLNDADLRMRMGRTARAGAVGRFDWASSATQFAELAGSLLTKEKTAEADQSIDVAGVVSTSSKTDS